jgi:DHA2 family methylenomycin A resistance protein-like MFS transporter
MSADTTEEATRRTPGPAAPARAPRSSAALTLIAACLGFFMITLDVSVVNVALPQIGRQLHGGLSALQWVAAGYTTVFAALLLSAGSLADRIGADRCCALGLAVFTAASAACGLAPGLGLLVGARVVQGAGAAVLLPASLALVRVSFPDAAARTRAIAVWTAAGGAAVAAGPVVGGVLTQTLGWRSIFFLNLPVGLVALAVTARAPRCAPRPAPLDLPGQAAAVLALAALTFGVIRAGAAGFGSVSALGALALAAVAALCFLAVESRGAQPMVPLGLFRRAAVGVCTATGFALNLAFYGIVFVISLYLQQVRGLSPLSAGLMFLPMTGCVTAVNLLSGRLTARFGPLPPTVAGQVILLGGMLGLLTVTEQTPTYVLMLLFVPLGIGGGMSVPALTAALFDAIEAQRAGLASGIFNSGRQVGGALGVAVFGALIAGAGAGTGGFVSGMRISLVLGAALLALTTLLTQRYLRPGVRAVLPAES